MPAKKVAIGRFNTVNFPECNTKAYQLELAAKLRKFADFLEDPNTKVAKRNELNDNDPNITWFIFGTHGQNKRHFDVWGGMTVPGKDNEFAD